MERFPDAVPHLEHEPRQKRVLVMLGARMYPSEGGMIFPLTLPEAQRPHESVVGRTSGGFARMRAVEGEFRKSPTKKDMVTLVTGGQEKGIGSRADEAAKTLIERYGLPPESVVSIGGLGSTLGNAAATAEYLATHREELGDVREIEIVTNDYHMLRAWIMFSRGMLEAAGKRLEVSAEDRARVRAQLDASLAGEWDAHRIKQTREEVMKILDPYFAATPIRIVPLVVEDAFERADAEGEQARGRYASMLRNHASVREVLRAEYAGIMDLLEGRYKGVL